MTNECDDSVDASRLLEQLRPAPLLTLLRQAAAMARQTGIPLYLVGGTVRDLLLGRVGRDVDLVVEGDALAFAQRLSETSGGELTTHPSFGTAKLRWPQQSLDMAMARAESYQRPGALPTVRPGTIQDDLRRRDFTINAMALGLAGPQQDQLVDPHGGTLDLRAGLVRVLHEGSFVDDATRILRALRYEQRLGFRLEDRTQELLRRDLDMISTLTPERIQGELELTLSEEQPERVLHRCQELGVLNALYPGLRGNGWLSEAFSRARKERDSHVVLEDLYLCLWTFPLSDGELGGLVQRLKLVGSWARLLEDLSYLKGAASRLEQPRVQPSEVYHLLYGRAPAAIQAVALTSDSPLLHQRLKDFLATTRYVKSMLKGEDLMALGVTPGPAMGDLLRQLREARMDGWVTTREDEEELARLWVASKDQEQERQ